MLGLKMDNSEDETFCAGFIDQLKQRGHGEVRLLVIDAHTGLAKAIRRQLQGCVVQSWGNRFAHNLLQCVPKAHQLMVKRPCGQYSLRRTLRRSRQAG
jgi:putative transposase